MDYGLPDILSALFRTRWRQSGDHRNTYAVEMICLPDHRGKANTAVYVSLSRLGYVLTLSRLCGSRSGHVVVKHGRRTIGVGLKALFGGLIGVRFDCRLLSAVGVGTRKSGP